MATLDLMETLRTALQAVPGYDELPEGTLPTLPILEATAFGQQHLVITFSVGVPPAAALVPHGNFPPALSLHVILPAGYTYWQPEAGTGHYLSAVLEVGQLSELYTALLRQCVSQLAAHPGGGYPLAQLSHYLSLLEQLATEGWLLREHQAPDEEKPLALALQQHLSQLAAPELATYYHTRGQALYTWIARVTYEKNWVERATDAMWNTTPAWLWAGQNDAFAVEATEAVPAILDGRQCFVIAFCHISKNAGSPGSLVYLPFGACYVSYPDTEIIWRPLRAENYFNFSSAPRDENGRPYLGKKEAGPADTEVKEVAAAYRQGVSLLLKRRWLLTQHAVTEEEQGVAQVLQDCIGRLYNPPLVAYYQHNAWQLLGWIRRATPEA